MSASVGKAADILRAFRPTVEVLSVRGLAERTGLPRSTVHLLCRTLCDNGLLEAVPHAGYRLGPLLLELGGLIIERTGLVAAVEGSTAALRRGPGQELHVGQLVEGWIVYLHRESGPDRVTMTNRVGMRAPAFLSGCGKSALPASTRSTPTSGFAGCAATRGSRCPTWRPSTRSSRRPAPTATACAGRSSPAARRSPRRSSAPTGSRWAGCRWRARAPRSPPPASSDIGEAVAGSAQVASTRLQVAGGRPTGLTTADRRAAEPRPARGLDPAAPHVIGRAFPAGRGA